MFWHQTYNTCRCHKLFWLYQAGTHTLPAGMTYEVFNLEPPSRKYESAQRHKGSTLLLDITDTTQFLPASHSIDGNIAVAFTTVAALKWTQRKLDDFCH